MEKKALIDMIVSQHWSTFPMLSNQTMSIVNESPELLKIIMTLCWNKNRAERPSFEAIHDYLAQEGLQQITEYHEKPINSSSSDNNNMSATCSSISSS